MPTGLSAIKCKRGRTGSHAKQRSQETARVILVYDVSEASTGFCHYADVEQEHRACGACPTISYEQDREGRDGERAGQI